jgi:hypothetical protein
MGGKCYLSAQLRRNDTRVASDSSIKDTTSDHQYLMNKELSMKGITQGAEG